MDNHGGSALKGIQKKREMWHATPAYMPPFQPPPHGRNFLHFHFSLQPPYLDQSLVMARSHSVSLKTSMGFSMLNEIVNTEREH